MTHGPTLPLPPTHLGSRIHLSAFHRRASSSQASAFILFSLFDRVDSQAECGLGLRHAPCQSCLGQASTVTIANAEISSIVESCR
ncbi:hypothetical protein LIA77_07653 [Sarocladium implicatum]|nr:hypothetical protein LIA77_07653 [Sarocladium implicatum]